MKEIRSCSSCVFLSFVLLVAFGVPAITLADKLDDANRALKMISEFANEICSTVPIEGTSSSVELTGDAKAAVSDLIKKLADLKIEGAAKYQDAKYKGVLQSDLAKVIESTGNCKKAIFEDLKDTLLPQQSNNTDGIPPHRDPSRPFISDREAATAAAEFIRLALDPSKGTPDALMDRLTTPFCNIDGIVYAAEDLRTSIERDYGKQEFGRAAASVADIQILGQVNFGTSFSTLDYGDDTIRALERCAGGEVIYPIDYLVRVKFELQDLRQGGTVNVVVDRRTGRVKGLIPNTGLM